MNTIYALVQSHGRLKAVAAQNGQALVEGLLVIAALLLLWVLSGWVLRLQDVALQASNAGRYAAFDLARRPDIGRTQLTSSATAYFSGLGQRWRDSRGRSWLSSTQSVQLSETSGSPLSALAQPGGQNSLAGTLRSQWGLADTGVREVTASVAPQTGVANQPRFIHRHAFIAVNAGHASEDLDVATRVRSSSLAWAQTELASRETGASLAARLQPLDAAWSRPEPQFNWLNPWQHEVPSRHLQKSTPFLNFGPLQGEAQ